MSDALNYLRSVRRLALRAVRERGREPTRDQGKHLVVDRWGLTVPRSDLERYLGATEGRKLNPSSDGRDTLPPLYPAVWETRLLMEMLSEPAAPHVRGAVVHLEAELMQIRVAEPSAIFRCRLELERVESRPAGRVLHVVGRSWNSAGHQCTESRNAFLLRDRKSSGAVRPVDTADEGNGTESREWRHVAEWRLRRNLGRKYARASGDYNPVHLSRLSALLFGFRRPILHGWCSAALVTHELLTAYCEGDPGALRRLRVSFRRPLSLPSRPRLIALEEGNRILFRVVDERDRAHASGELVASRTLVARGVAT